MQNTYCSSFLQLTLLNWGLCVHLIVSLRLLRCLKLGMYSILLLNQDRNVDVPSDFQAGILTFLLLTFGWGSSFPYHSPLLSLSMLMFPHIFHPFPLTLSILFPQSLLCSKHALSALDYLIPASSLHIPHLSHFSQFALPQVSLSSLVLPFAPSRHL